MRQHHALGESRGAARVREYREIPRRVDWSARGRRGGLDQGRERRGGGRAAQNEDLLDAHLLRDWRGPIHELRHRDEESGTGTTPLEGGVLARREPVLR